MLCQHAPRLFQHNAAIRADDAVQTMAVEDNIEMIFREVGEIAHIANNEICGNTGGLGSLSCPCGCEW